MASKAMNFKLEESKIADMRDVAKVFNMTMTNVVNEALDYYLKMMKKDPLYKLTANVKEVSASESTEILKALDEMADEDFEISSSKEFIL